MGSESGAPSGSISDESDNVSTRLHFSDEHALAIVAKPAHEALGDFIRQDKVACRERRSQQELDSLQLMARFVKQCVTEVVDTLGKKIETLDASLEERVDSKIDAKIAEAGFQGVVDANKATLESNKELTAAVNALMAKKPADPPQRHPDPPQHRPMDRQAGRDGFYSPPEDL